jgi:hypothetical protein
LLSENERKIIKRYLENGEKLDGYRTLLYRAKKETVEEGAILQDLKLLKEFLSKA